VTLPTGESRLAETHPDLQLRLSLWGVKASDFIPGFRVTYRELDNICQSMRNEGWSGFIGLDEAVRAVIKES